MTLERRRQQIGAGLAGLLLLVALAFGLPSAGAVAKDTATASATTTFGFTGGEQTFEVPDGITSLDVVAVGGKGGSEEISINSGDGGFGAVATAKLAVTPGQRLFIEVGGNGGTPQFASPGFNGGGAGSTIPGSPDGGGGGGASDIRTISSATAGDTLGSRLIIAGGGGGGGGGVSPATSGGAGGDAGELGSGNGSDGADAGGAAGTKGFGGTQTAGGFSLSGEPGGPGTGGDGEPAGSGDFGAGGGGGGKFGGGGGTSTAGGGGGGGGGSSSFAPTATTTSFSTDTTGVPLIRLTFNPGAGGNKSGLKFGKVKLNKRKGTATLPVTVPGSGNLTVGGKGVVKKRPGLFGRGLARKVDSAGTYKLKVKAKGRKKRKLFATGKVRVKAVVKFKPSSGDAVKDTKRIRLKKN